MDEPRSQRLEDIRTAFDARAATYDESTMHREVATAVAGFADLAEVENILDIATGTGLVLRALALRAPAATLTGIDLSPAMLEVARANLPDATFIEADAALVPLDDHSVDLITCVTALHVIAHIPAAMSEWHRLLRPGARAVTATFVAAAQDGVPRRAHGYPADHRPFESLEQLSATTAQHGFEVSRSALWSDEVDTLLIAEWMRAGD